jgi:hypothetical protein
MRTSVTRIVLLGTLLWGCTPPAQSDEPSGTGGTVNPGRAGSGGTSSGSTGGTSGGSTSGGTTGTPTASGGNSGSGGAPTGNVPPSSGGNDGNGSSGSGGSPAAPDAAPTASDAGPPAADPGGGPIPGCPKCKSIFDGKTLDGWEQSPAGSFVVKDGAIASTGKGAHAWTKDDYGDFRMFLTVRQISGNHKPCTTLWGTRPAPGGAPARGLKGIQFQPPMGGSWDYRSNTDPKGKPQWVYPNPRPQFVVTKWNRCEIIARVSKGEFRAACCEIEGKQTCQAMEVLHYTDPTNKKGPFTLQMHNAGLFDEFKDIYVDTDPVGDDLISTK